MAYSWEEIGAGVSALLSKTVDEKNVKQEELFGRLTILVNGYGTIETAEMIAGPVEKVEVEDIKGVVNHVWEKRVAERNKPVKPEDMDPDDLKKAIEEYMKSKKR